MGALVVQLEKRRDQYRVMLPSHIKPERFERTVITAVNNNPDLLGADRRSFFNACARSASDGLLPDGREGALVIFKDSDGTKKVSWMPMVFGLLKKIRQSGEIDSVGARIVYQREIDEKRFSFVVSDGQEKLYHDPMLWGDRGDKVLVYAYARFKNGFVQYMPLHRNDVLKRRKAAKTDKVWSAWEDEMWLKTAIRAIAGKLPLSSEIIQSIEREEETEFDKMRSDAMAALAAPQIEGPAEDEAQFEEQQTDEQQQAKTDERVVITATQFIENATSGLASNEYTTRAQIEEDAEALRVSLSGFDLPPDERMALLRKLNTAVLERINSLGKRSR